MFATAETGYSAPQEPGFSSTDSPLALRIENPLMAYALDYAARGWPVFPCKPREKIPLTQHGLKDATVNLDIITRWWTQYPHANIGLVTGAGSGLVAIDVDRHEDKGIDGAETLRALEERHGRLPETVEQITGSGGSQLFFRHPGGTIPNSASKLGLGIDVRGDGGYVVVPPSIHPNGRTYEWEVFHPLEDTELADLPPAWVVLLRSSSNGARGHAADGEPIGEGQRNDALFRLGCFMRGRGMSAAAIHAALLAENAARCLPPLSDAEVQKIAAGAARYDEQPAPWPEPGALPKGLHPVPAFPEVLIPAPFRPWLVDIAARMQCPVEFPTVGAIVSLASLVGRRIGIKPKCHDDWLVIPNLWGAVIGRPGIMKSPALAEAMKPLHRLELQARAKFEEELKGWEFKKLVLKAQKEELERKIREALRNEEGIDHLSKGLSAEQQGEPVLARYVINDSTVEKLGELLNQNPNGLLLFRDELTGWLRTLDRDGHEGDRAFYLEAWNGNGSYTYDRIGRGTLPIEAACVSILGGIQPGPLANYLRAAVRGDSGDDGLIQRFQLAVYPDDIGSWRNVDRRPDSEAKNRAWSIFQRLATCSAGDMGATLVPAIPGVSVNTDEAIPFLRFTPEAQDIFDTWRTDLENKIRSGEDHPVLVDHLSKYRSLMPSLALLFHLLEGAGGAAPGPVSKQAAKMAAAWCDFLEAHARRIYQGVTQRALFGARRLAERIKAGALQSPFTLGEVLRKGWAGLSTLEEAREAAEVLEDLHWLRPGTVSAGEKGGRPRSHYHINPHLRGKEKAA